MTSPAWIATGSGSATAPAWPAGHAAGDFGLLFVACSGGTIATPSGWTKIHQIFDNDAAGSIAVFDRFAASGAETAPSLSGGTSMWGVITTYTGVNTLTPIHGQVGSWVGSVSLTQQIAGASTLIEEVLVVMGVALVGGGTGPFYSSPTNASLSSPTIRYDAGVTGSSMCVVDGGLADAGPFPPTVITCSAATTGHTSSTLCLVATNRTLQFAAKSRVVNTEM